MKYSRKPSKNIYLLPFDRRFNLKPKSAYTHYDGDGWQKYAVDFAMPIGTKIFAAQEGYVYDIWDGFEKGELKKSYLYKCNLVILEHEKEEFSVYVHLKKGIELNEGEYISKGSLIGYSGVSGYTNYPHLHFDISKDKGATWETIPARFQVGNEIKILYSPKK